jgi:hypothetical protein
MLTGWLTDMDLLPASPSAQVNRDEGFQEEVRNSARGARRGGQAVESGAVSPGGPGHPRSAAEVAAKSPGFRRFTRVARKTNADNR